ncbi:hypothetical protein CRG98_019848 [Punica granatum]|uniref:Uncharacterized protein n=1 Tax=Punica granatum TaxID=22663 RepID=A0A2I0JTX4_PUNGR|nr:hypothetical protein CRG98_019848 [Punica granatum]
MAKGMSSSKRHRHHRSQDGMRVQLMSQRIGGSLWRREKAQGDSNVRMVIGQFELKNQRKEFNKINKQVAQLRIVSSWTQLKSRFETIGNLVHDSVPISDDETNNAVIRTWGEKRVKAKLKNHVELIELLDIADMKKVDNEEQLEVQQTAKPRIGVSFTSPEK